MASIESTEQLDELLTEPTSRLVEFIRRVASPLVVLGASGKMGPSLAVLAKRAAREAGHELEVVGVARFGDPAARSWLESHGVRTIQCDVLDRAQVDALPDARDVIYMVGRKFGTSDDPSLTWTMNSLAPINALERYRSSRIVALSTGTVYALADVARGGSRETDVPEPIGEYANACLGRERIFEYYARHHGVRTCIVRLNYAVEMRYGVIVDIAQKIARDEPVDVSMGYLNCIWQRDANDYCIRMLDHVGSPARVLNLTGPETLAVRDLALRLGELMGKRPRIVGTESSRAYLNDASDTFELLGMPAVDIDRILRWTADWVSRGGATLGKPTHFEVSDGRY
jgi:nucleoside-diphosphate-sugar epimerase